MLSCLLTVGGAQAEILDVSDSQFFFNSSLEELQKQSAFALPTNRQCVRLGRALAFYGVTEIGNVGSGSQINSHHYHPLLAWTSAKLLRIIRRKADPS
jgi:hypothetical protein